MSASKVQCPRCGQDWLKRVLLVALDREAILCLECDALWLNESDIMRPVEGSYGVTWHDYCTAMRTEGRSEPHGSSELSVIGDLLR